MEESGRFEATGATDGSYDFVAQINKRPTTLGSGQEAAAGFISVASRFGMFREDDGFVAVFGINGLCAPLAGFPRLRTFFDGT
jgi:hypothetical protein